MINFLLGLFISACVFEFIIIIFLINKNKKNEITSNYDSLKDEDSNYSINKSDFFV